MPSSSSTSAQRARQALADQLKEIRLRAGLSGTELARAAGWSGVDKVSRIEHAARPPSVADVLTWCRVCGVDEQRTEELLAEQKAVSTMWTDSRRINRAGLRGAQKSVRPIWERSTLVRTYQPRLIPGLLQTPAYATAVLTSVRARLRLQVDDVAAAVAERMSRQRVLRRAGRQFIFLIEEAALRYRLYEAHVLVDQLTHLEEVTRLPTVSLGIIPLAASRTSSAHAVPVEGFNIFDDRQVQVELVSGELNITQGWEIALYAERFRALGDIADFGGQARRRIAAARAALGE
ncbi:helix-turn-helix domain-containing protein [Nonomuraea candida]|uniref:helix-turn-helix domain-containing protein n=1 Tax=Nonomuraea candida TaxID=359159 RepID=UPI0005BCCDD8|nr:helix-turn-helix transcriptional regulator [Nonomuraea candida]